MSIDYEKGLYVNIVELDNGPHPKPLSHGFSVGFAYRVLGIYNPSESGECWLIMANDRDELWYISQRHVRVSHLASKCEGFRTTTPRVMANNVDGDFSALGSEQLLHHLNPIRESQSSSQCEAL